MTQPPQTKRYVIGVATGTPSRPEASVDLAALARQLDVVRIIGNREHPSALVALLTPEDVGRLQTQFPTLIVEDDRELQLS
jgi:hypothetical protein